MKTMACQRCLKFQWKLTVQKNSRYSNSDSKVSSVTGAGFIECKACRAANLNLLWLIFWTAPNCSEQTIIRHAMLKEISQSWSRDCLKKDSFDHPWSIRLPLKRKQAKAENMMSFENDKSLSLLYRVVITNIRVGGILKIACTKNVPPLLKRNEYYILHRKGYNNKISTYILV